MLQGYGTKYMNPFEHLHVEQYRVEATHVDTEYH